MTRTLILGGTGWLGLELARQLLDRGEEVTCLARGSHGQPPEGARFVRADRTQSDAYDAVRHQHWDAVVELAYEPTLVRGALAALADRAAHWTLVSTISVYARNDVPEADENAELLEPSDLTDYGQAKVAAERASADALGDRLLIARPGLIAGPGDPSDRFSYWVSRFALAAGGPVLAPDTTGLHAQVIDVRNLAAWLSDAAATSLTGVVNAVGTAHPLKHVLAAAAKVAGHTGELVEAEDEWLRENEVAYWAGSRSLPLWLPRADSAMAHRSRHRYVDSGGAERSLDALLREVLDDELERGLDRPRRSGLTREDELSLLERRQSRR